MHFQLEQNTVLLQQISLMLRVVLSRCDIKISVVSQCRILVAVQVQYMKTKLFTFLFLLTTCTCWTAQWLGRC